MEFQREKMTMQFERLVQVTDMHLFENLQQTLSGSNVYQLLLAIIKNIQWQPAQPSLILLTGDLSQDGSKTSYQQLAKLFKAFSCPILWTPGNHDNPQHAEAILKNTPLRSDKWIQLPSGWVIILLNSYWKGHLEGALPRSELTFLKEILEKFPSQNKMIFLHHHVMPVESEWLDKLMLQNPEEFFSIIDHYSAIKAVISGHTHQEFVEKRRSIPFITTPATSFQVLKKSQHFALDTVEPGYRYFNLYPDGHFDTEVIRVRV
jgi:Icc protein